MKLDSALVVDIVDKLLNVCLRGNNPSFKKQFTNKCNDFLTNSFTFEDCRTFGGANLRKRWAISTTVLSVTVGVNARQLQYIAVQCGELQCSTVQPNGLQCSVVYSAAQYLSATQCNTILCRTGLYSAVHTQQIILWWS